MIWICKDFEQLSINELYQILKIRQEVFIVEQNCNYLDADGVDHSSQHLLCYNELELVAYMRIIPKGVLYDHISFGRILVKKEFRQAGIGKEMIQRAIDMFSHNEIILMSAQLYLKEFYTRFGFKSTGEDYLEDDIPHIKMIKNG